MKYNKGDIIGYTDYDHTCLCKVIGSLRIDFSKEAQESLQIEIIYTDFYKVCSNHSILLPEEENQIITKEEYFAEMQKYIDEKQDILNKIKEQYEPKTEK